VAWFLGPPQTAISTLNLAAALGGLQPASNQPFQLSSKQNAAAKTVRRSNTPAAMNPPTKLASEMKLPDDAGNHRSTIYPITTRCY